MYRVFGTPLMAYAIVASSSIMAAPQLFNVELKGATRDQIRSALYKTNVEAIRENDSYWVDMYNPNGVLQGAKTLNFGYTSNGKFAYAEYNFPVFMDTGKILEVANLVSSKYGKPSKVEGNPNLGSVKYIWNFKNGMVITVYRGWPDTTTYLEFKDKQNVIKLNQEVDAEKRRQFQEKAQEQSNAF